VEKQMTEQNNQQKKQFRRIKKRMETIRQASIDQITRSESFTPETYAQGKFFYSSIFGC
jgi:hypothetical protein